MPQLAPVFTFLFTNPFGQALLGAAIQYGVGRWQQSRQRQRPAPGISGQLRAGGDLPLTLAFGNFATKGSRVYTNSWGSAGATPNAYFVDVIDVAQAPIDGMDALFVDGKACTVDWMATPADMGYPVTDFRKAGTDYLWVRFRDGRQSTADSYLVSKFSGHATRPWGATRIGTGIADMIVTARLDREQFKSFPSYTFVGRGMRLHDLRDGAQVENDPSTHLFTRNNAVIAWNVMRGIKAYWAGGGSEWMFGPQALALAHLPTSAWVAAMNACDEAFDLDGGGTEPQFAMGGTFACDRQPAEVLTEIFASAAGFLADVGYGFKPKIGAPSAPVLSFDDGQIVVTSKQGYEPYAGLEASHNAIAGQYSEPALGYAMKDLPKRTDAAALAEDDNQLLVDDVQYPLVQSGPTAQRLMAARLADTRLWRRHQLALGHGAALLEPVDVVGWTSARNGYTAKNFELAGGIELSRALSPSLAMKETDAGSWDWDESTDEDASPVTPLTPPAPVSQPMSGWTASPSSLPAEGGGSPRPSIRVTWTGQLDDVRAVQVQVRLAATSALVFDGETPYDPADASPFTDLNGVFSPNTAYQARGRFIPFGARPTGWSGWLAVTTGDHRIGGGDIFDGIVDRAKLAADIEARFEWGGAGALAAIDELHQLALDIAEGRLGTHFDAQVREQRVAAVAENARAEVVRVDAARLTAEQATADALTVLRAAFGGNESQILVRFQATAGASGAEAAWSMQLWSTSQGRWVQVGETAEIVNGIGRRVFAYDQVLFTVPGDPTPFAVLGPDKKVLIDRLAVNQLSALSADLGTVTAGVIESDDGTFVIDLDNNLIEVDGEPLFTVVGGVSKLNVDVIEAGSLTQPASISFAGSVATTSTTFQPISASDCEIEVEVPEGATVLVWLSATGTIGNTSATTQTVIYREGSPDVQISGIARLFGSVGGSAGSSAVHGDDAPPAGTHVYKGMFRSSGTYTATITEARLTVQVFTK